MAQLTLKALWGAPLRAVPPAPSPPVPQPEPQPEAVSYNEQAPGAAALEAEAPVTAPDSRETGNAYERLRDERVRRNREVMASLGLNAAAATLAVPAAARKPAARRERRVSAPEPASKRATRATRATRCTAVADAEAAEAAESEEAEEEFFESGVAHYVCQQAPNADASSLSVCAAPAGSSPPAAFLHAPERTYSDGKLERIYAVDTSGCLLAAAGHGGRCAVFAASQAHALLSWRAHGGWACAAQFLSSLASAPLLLTASNDAAVCVWDLAQAADGAPRRVAFHENLHAKGIFSCHAVETQVWSSSKDETTRCSTLTPDGRLVAGRQFQGHHTGVVKCVRAREAHLAADAGNDGSICLLDERAADACTLRIEDAHPSHVNVLEWHPSNAHLLLSAGCDPAIRLWDVRAPAAPLHVLVGHTAIARLKHIYRPAFVAAGAAVATPGEGSERLSLYCCSSGRALSRGALGFDASTSCCAAPAERGAALLLAHKGTLRTYAPLWDAPLEHEVS